MANQQIVVRVVELPRIEDPKQRDAAVRFQASEAIAMPLDEAVLDHQVAGYAEAPDGTPRMQVVLVAARRKMIERLPQAVKAGGLKAEGIHLDAFALVRTLAVNGHGGEDSARVFCHLGGVTNLAVAVGSNCFFTRPLSAVWDDEDAGSRLADEIRLSIDYYMTQPEARPVSETVLSGPARPTPRSSRASACIWACPSRSPLRSGSSTRPVSAPARIPTATRWPRACRSELRTKPVNLLPQDQRRRQPSEGGGKSAYVVLGVLGLLLAMVAVYVVTGNQVTDSQTKAAAAKAEADSLQAQAAKQADYVDFAAIADAPPQLGGRRRADPLRLGALHARAVVIMPEGSWIQRPTGSVFGDPLDASAAATADPTAAAAPAQPAASLVGCVPDQTDTARMMVRLRAMHRVDDVELKESATQTGENEVTPENCGSYYKFDLIKFSPTAPIAEAPRNSGRVPASLGGGS